MFKKTIILLHESDSNVDYKHILDTKRDIAFIGVPPQKSDSLSSVSFDTKWFNGPSFDTPINITFVSNLVNNSTTWASISNQFIDSV